jgi:hypothetical protein
MSEVLKAMNPNDMAEDQLVQWLEMTPPDDVLLRVGEDSRLAERVLAAEKARKPASARRKDLIEGLEQVGVPPEDPKATKAENVTPPGTVWLGEHHVEVGSAAYDALLTQGFTPGPAPKDAGPLKPE